MLSIGVLPKANRLYFLVAGGIFVEQDSPGTAGDAWVKTSRIRFDTTIPKLWTRGAVTGTPESGFSVLTTRASGSTDSHTDVDDTTGVFDFDSDLDPWI